MLMPARMTRRYDTYPAPPTPRSTARMQLDGWGDIPEMKFMTVMLRLGCLDPV